MVSAEEHDTSAGWVKNLVMLTALAGWASAVIATLASGGLPDPVLLGVPGGLYVALNPPKLSWRRDEGSS